MNRFFAVLFLAPLLTVSACEDDGGRRLDDGPPDTSVEASSLDTPGRTVTFRWDGSDDGDVVGFEWRLSANGEDGVVDVADTLLVPWNETEASEQTLSLDADIPGPPPGSDEDLFYQTYTLFVRAIDDQGQRDPSPAHVSVTATTVAPSVRIRERFFRTSCSELSIGYGFSWEVEDPDAEAGDELEVRWLLVPVGGPDDPCLTDLQYAALSPGPIQADDPRWSDWVTYVEPGGEGGRHGEASLPEPVGSNYLFAVQARDAAGAVTPMFEWFENVMHFRTAPDRYPLLTVWGPEIWWISDVASAPVRWRREVPAGFSLDFRAQASLPFEVDAPFEYRWGVDVDGPERDDGAGWRTEWTSTPPVVEGLVLEVGPHTIAVESRDRYGVVTSTQFGLDVLEVPDRATQRPVLVVDDAFDGDSPDTDAIHDALVESWLDGIPGFDPAQDVIDLESEGERVTMAKLLGYRSVLWLTNAAGPEAVSPGGPGGAAYARTLGGAWLSMLELYQRHVGNVMVMGPAAMTRALQPQLENVVPPLEVPDPPFEFRGVSPVVSGLRPEAGRLTYSYQAFGLQFIDQVGPLSHGVLGAGRPPSDPCDHIATVEVAPEALTAFGVDGAAFDAWEPVDERLSVLASGEMPGPVALSLPREEIYGRPFDGRDTDEASGVVPLMLAVARRDRAGDPECVEGGEPSPNTGWPVALASQRFAKERAPGPDLILGLNPFGFAVDDVRAFVEAVVFDLWGAAER